MPIYDYKCKECSHNWEEQQSLIARNVPRYNPCPECGSSGNIIIYIGKVKKEVGQKEGKFQPTPCTKGQL
ncbi:TPA: zinc ribbon domain-containing protein [Candidatus Woesearchaeota archaeon]|nr:zinc ribbon domain-containing protein [Candidatus Woesearchaeota archaeon]